MKSEESWLCSFWGGRQKVQGGRFRVQGTRCKGEDRMTILVACILYAKLYSLNPKSYTLNPHIFYALKYFAIG